jgi:hypothetical protein
MLTIQYMREHGDVVDQRQIDGDVAEAIRLGKSMVKGSQIPSQIGSKRPDIVGFVIRNESGSIAYDSRREPI